MSEDYGHEPPQLGESSVVMCNEETLRIGVHEGAFYPKAAEWLLVPLQCSPHPVPSVMFSWRSLCRSTGGL